MGMLSTLLLASSFSYGNISGVVYKDFNLNGQQDANDVGVSAVTITAVCEDGSTSTATTNQTGAYTIVVATAGNQCRIEANPSHIGMGSSANAVGSSPLVDMVSDNTVHNISVASPATFCQANPDVVMIALPGGSIPDPISQGTLFKVPLPADGEFNNQYTIDAKRTELSKLSDTGAVWGLAYKKSTKDLYAAANVKRYVPLKNNEAGAIYKIDQANVTTLFATVPNTGYTLANRDYSQNHDTDILSVSAKVGLGDLDISEDETKLYVVNLASKELVTIDANTGAILTNTALPNPYTNAECPASDVRPWALKVLGNDVYIGSVCESGIEAGVGATVQKYNGAIVQTVAKTNTLTYLKPRTYDPTTPSRPYDANYNWDTNKGHSPILTDIEFSNTGDMILGYTDRVAYNRKIGNSSGDVRKMCLNMDGTFTDESTEKAATNCATHTVSYNGNPEVYSEFYLGDYFGINLGEGHPETAAGAMAQAPGRDNIVVGMVDGTDWYQPGAIALYSHTSGDKVGAQAVIKNDSPGERDFYAGKAGGLGDVELLCDPAPIEVGNYVWEDSNQNGIQDPGEPAFAGVPVKLYDNAGTLVGTATTDANGHYYFGGINNANGVTIQPHAAYELRIAQANVSNKAPTMQNANANADDIRDNDAVAVGTNNVIPFTTTLVNNHDLDFGIQPSLGCAEGVLFQDTNNNGVQDGVDTVAPAGITVTITDKNGHKYNAVTTAAGFFQIAGVATGSATLTVDTTDTDIPQGAVWTTPTTTINLVESTPSGTPSACAVQPFPYTLPAPLDQDPKDVATCAQATSITWDGSNKSSKSVWTNMISNNSLATAKQFATAGGTVVNASMYVTDPDTEFNNASAGTSAAFGQPYLTLYLGDQNSPGNGTFNDAVNCAANGYDLVAGEKSELVVEFDVPVILDNWRIRDVDSGDDRAGVSNWNWQDGIIATAEDANGNPVTIESKIGTSGAGLLKDASKILHTDPATYNGGNVATGTGTTPNATNGHIVLTSNFVPVKKITITHIAGPDVPCQTRSALAMAGLSVCVPLHVSGTIFNDADGAQLPAACDTSNGQVDGTAISEINATTPLYAQLIDASGKIIDLQKIKADGTYYFDKFIKPNSTYKVILTESNQTIGNNGAISHLPQGWKHEGEKLIGGALDSTVDGVVTLDIVTASVDNIDFGINKVPTATGYTRPSEVNPGGTNAVQIAPVSAVLANFVTDKEETTPSRIKIITVPSNGALTYQNVPVSVGQIIDSPDVSAFTFDPNDGDIDAALSYVSMDKACRESTPAIWKVAFNVPLISGNLYLDTNNDANVDGNATANSCDGITPLFVNLVNPTSNAVISSVALRTDGSYTFYNPDVQANTNYDLILSQIEGKNGDATPSAKLPAGCMGTGENKGANANNAEGTPANGIVSVSVGTVNVPELNFGISPSVKIGDLVWIEDDNDGKPATGVVTYPAAGTAVTATAPNGTVYTGTTDANGKYTIEVPANASYLVKVAQPTGTVPTLGSTDSSITDVTSENNKPHNNAGTTVSVASIDNLTVDFGFTLPSVPNVHIGDTIWIEDDKDGNPTTGTITYPAVGTVVTATAADGTVYTGVTDATGHYDIEVAANTTYVVTVTTPTGTIPTKGSADNSVPNDDSENNHSHNGAGTTVVVGTTDNMTLDFGFTPPSVGFTPSQTTAIGNLFWLDDNANGKVDANEEGYNGVIVTLYDANGTKLATQTTHNGVDGKAGFYLFDNLTPDKEYKVHFDYSNVAALKDYVFSPKVGGENNSNANDQGFTVSVTPKGGAPILTLDAGIHCGCSNAPISANGGDALSMMGMLAMMLLTLMTALFFVRKEEEQRG